MSAAMAGGNAAPLNSTLGFRSKEALNIIRLLALFAMASLLSGCIAATYVSSIGMRNQHTKVVENEAGEKKVILYESKMEPVGGPCTSFIPYVSLIPSNKKKLIERREYIEGSLTPDKEYRKWYGYPAQSLQVIAVPTDVAIVGAIFVGGLVAMPVFFVKDLVSSEKPAIPPKPQ